MNHDDPPSLSFSHPLLSLISAAFWVLLWLLSWAKYLISIVPRIIYFVLSYSMTLTLDFWSFVFIFAGFTVAANYWLRFVYFNKYTQLKEQPLNKPDAKELHPDVNTEPQRTTFNNYLDDFLQAVRVFGFLEQPVFHELTRHLQTRRLAAGDSLYLDQDKSFYCVIDGNVQVYTYTRNVTNVRRSSWDDDPPREGLQLLNEVGPGGTLSSLFTILSLFTEDVPLSWPDNGEPSRNPLGRMPFSQLDNDVSQLSLDATATSTSATTTPLHHRSSIPSTPSMAHPSVTHTPKDVSDSLPGSFAHRQRGVVARASEDSTLAVLPAEVFHRLTKKFPKATSHIVQVILTRFSRVTFTAAHKYLGLTSEVLQTEKSINDLAYQPLPPEFYEGGGLRDLRHRFDTNDDPEETSFVDPPSSSSSQPALHNPAAAAPLARSNSLYSDTNSISPNSSPILTSRRLPASFTPSSRWEVQAGDLVTSTRQGPGETVRIPSLVSTPRLSRKTVEQGLGKRSGAFSSIVEEGFDLKNGVMSCIAKSIGLLQPPLSGSDSTELSPHSHAADASRSPPILRSLRSLSMLGTRDDGTSSITSPTLATPDSYMTGLDNEVKILYFPSGSLLTKAGDVEAGLYYVIDGFLDILLPAEHIPTAASSTFRSFPNESEPWRTPSHSANTDGSPQHLFTVKPGGIAGYLSSLCHTPSYADIKAKTNVFVGFLSSQALDRLIEKRPIVLLTLAKRLLSLLSPLILHLDASLDWMQTDGGQVLWRPHDASDSFYIVINGRLRLISESQSGDVSILSEYGQGDSVGELDVITSSPRRNTLHAIRDTELIRMPRTLFNAISSRNPQVTAQILRTIASHVRDEAGTTTKPQVNQPSKLDNTNLRTIAIIPSSRLVPVDIFAKKLHAALEGIGASTISLTQASVSGHLGRHVFTRMGKLKAAGWLSDQEQKYRTVLYIADSPVNSPWTQTCIRQADFVLVVGMGSDVGLGEYERLLLSMKTTARKELVLLHPERSVVPGLTREWLKNRPWVHRHLHVYVEECRGLIVPMSKSEDNEDPEAMKAFKNLKEKVQSRINRYRGIVADPPSRHHAHMDDFARVARRICGKSIGIVLGGGGARGCAHLGLIQALEEYGIPIDHIGGTSIGAFVGGLYAREANLISAAGRTKQFSSRMGNIWRILSDVTYPIVAYTTGHEFNRTIYKAFYDCHIEDMWLPYFCNTTNIMTSQMQIHETGYAWRFIRASMSLVGLLPPLCDQGHLLVDGGYMDNLPVSTLTSMGSSLVIACDVGGKYDNSPRNVGDHVSGWWLLINRYNPFSTSKSLPDITEIQSRLAYAASVSSLEDAKNAQNCLYIQMPVQDYGTLQFSKFEEIQERGYQAAMEMLRQWDKEGRLPTGFIDHRLNDQGQRKKRGRGVRRNSV